MARTTRDQPLPPAQGGGLCDFWSSRLCGSALSAAAGDEYLGLVAYFTSCGPGHVFPTAWVRQANFKAAQWLKTIIWGLIIPFQAVQAGRFKITQERFKGKGTLVSIPSKHKQLVGLVLTIFTFRRVHYPERVSVSRICQQESDSGQLWGSENWEAGFWCALTHMAGRHPRIPSEEIPSSFVSFPSDMGKFFAYTLSSPFLYFPSTLALLSPSFSCLLSFMGKIWSQVSAQRA